ncbi:MAG: hypothetical protein ACRBBO_15455 [Cognatishimia sp.]
MTVKNKPIRDGVRQAIKDSTRFSDFGQVGIWDKKVNAEDLPAFGVGVPRWSPELDHSFNNSEITTTVIVVVKRVAGDLEDLTDEDSDEIQRLVCDLLDTDEQEVSLQECTYQEDTGGEKPVATLSMMFVIKYWPANS